MSSIMKNGLLYEIRVASIMDNGRRVKIGEVEVPAPTAETYQKYVDAGILTIADMCKCYIESTAITLQAAARRAKVAKTITKEAYKRLYNKIATRELMTEYFTTNPTHNPAQFKDYVDELINAEWELEQAA